jgi:endogenous inhibitor of DNA gyrase (YacG/DUF329 family)
MNSKERDEHETPCPRCGAEVEWSYLSPENSEIEVMCPECGRFVMRRDEFDKAMADQPELERAWSFRETNPDNRSTL